MKFENLLEDYKRFRKDIEDRLEEFKGVLKEREERIFAELSFCLLTPQSKAKVCWAAIEALMGNGLLFKGSKEEILPFLKGIRFKKRKAEYIVLARDALCGRLKELLSGFLSSRKAREYLVKQVKGMGYKEASHFLRNVGLGFDLAILDRHILKNLRRFGVIDELPKSLSPKRYLEIEDKMVSFSRSIGIPMAHLDLLFWARETGEVFK